jgi:hypothetical protein
VPGGPAHGGFALATDPDREARLLHRPGVDGHLTEAVLAPLEVRSVLAPEQVEDLQLLL